MSAIAGSISRVPTFMSSQVLLNNINRTQVELLQLQTQMATGKRVNRPSDDVISASLINTLQNEMDRRQQRFRSLDHADNILSSIDQSVGEASDLVIQAKSIASEMVNTSIDSETRKNQATIVDSLIDELTRVANRESGGVHYFAGKRTSQPAVESKLGGFKFTGTMDTLKLDVGRGSGLPITVSAADAFGAVSARVAGNVDLNPQLTGEMRIRDLNGARGLGVALGSVNIDLNGLDTIAVDLSKTDSVQDVADVLQDAIQQYETDNSVTLLGTNGVGINGSAGAISIDTASGVTLTISDTLTGKTAADLGLSQAAFTTGNSDGADLDPKVTELTAISDLTAVSGLGSFIISNAGQSRTIDLSGAKTVQDVMNVIKAADIGVRVEISPDGKSLNVLNDLSGGKMSIYNVPGGDTADQLGIRSVRRDTPLSEFNHGRGVQILSGNVDPVTGQPDPLLDRDFTVHLHDGTSFDVDLSGANTLGDVVDIMNAAGPSSFTASIDSGSGGLLLTDSTTGTNKLKIEVLNGSFAAQDLGIQQSTDSATITGEDRAKVEVDSVFSHLLALRDALAGNDIPGITFAGADLERDVNRVAQMRAIVGQRINNVDDIRQRELDEDLLDASLKSQAQDLDFTKASVQFSQLQTFLQATLTAGAQTQSLSLLNFLG